MPSNSLFLMYSAPCCANFAEMLNAQHRTHRLLHEPVLRFHNSPRYVRASRKETSYKRLVLTTSVSPFSKTILFRTDPRGLCDASHLRMCDTGMSRGRIGARARRLGEGIGRSEALSVIIGSSGVARKGYLLKTHADRDLVSAIKSLLRSKTSVS